MKINFWKTIVLAGLLVGSLDIIAALVNSYIQTGKNPVIVLRYIASAVFGKKVAYAEDNNLMPALGLLFHFIVAYSWTVLFFLIYPRLKFMSANRILTGILYGIFIWTMMTFIVLPVSFGRSSPIVMKQALIAIAILIVAIGLPLSFIAYRCYYEMKK